jgi:thiamine pyrophosphokinase
MPVNRCVIIGGAEIGDYSRISRILRGDDFFICCDSGLRHAEKLRITPSLIVGDFDSSERPDTDIETIALPREKDDTDSVYAAKEAVRRGYENFLLIGMIGERFDHTFGNVSLLLWLDSIGKKAQIADDYSEMEIVSRGTAEIDDSYAFFSLLNISGTAQDITIRGAKYPLEGAEITSEYQYGISNEVIPGGKATVSVGKGRVLLVKIQNSECRIQN